MAYITALFLTSVKSCLKKNMYYKNVWSLLFLFDFQRSGNFLHFSRKFQFFSKTTTVFQKMFQMDKQAALLCAYIIS